MATYTELRNLLNDSILRNRVEVACIIAAETIRNEDPAVTNHSNRLIWAKRTFSSPDGVRQEMLNALLAANSTASVEAIQSSTDAQIQTRVDNAVDVFADGT